MDYARLLDVPFVFASNGDGFIFHDKTNSTGVLESEISVWQNSLSPQQLWQKFCVWKGYTQAAITSESPKITTMMAVVKHHVIISCRPLIRRLLRYLLVDANRALLVMATGTGKTYTAFQIIWRLWKSRQKKRILFLADRNILVDQTRLKRLPAIWSSDDKSGWTKNRSCV